MSEQLFRENEPNLFPHVNVNLQSSTSSWSRSDDADSPYDFPLFKFQYLFPFTNEILNEFNKLFRLLKIDESIIYKVPTIRKLRALFDNYEVDASDSENVTPNELQENDDFINAVLDTTVMQTAMKFLNRKGFYN